MKMRYLTLWLIPCLSLYALVGAGFAATETSTPQQKQCSCPYCFGIQHLKAGRVQ